MLSAKSRAEVDKFFGSRKQPETTDQEERREIRSRILRAINTGHSAPRELEQILYDLEVGTLAKELKALIALGSVKWNGRRGPASRYLRAP